MRSLIAIAAVLAVGLGVKMFSLSSPTAKANVDAVQMDISQMHQSANNLPVQKIDDMSVGVD